ncbi:response regulator [Methanosarcina hadiensis]|uniref:response regulator n=1 Tax=Methanosarcina hadiensis TaxID=3078083 RepID=UPI003977BCDF
MKIREKTLTILGITFILLSLFLVVATEQIMGKSFELLEKDDISRNMERAKAALDSQITVLDMMTYDYAVWDDTYYFVQGQSDDYIDGTLSPELITNLDTNFILFYDSTNNLYYATAVKQGATELSNVSDTMLDCIAANERLFSHSSPDSQVSGIINSPEGPLLISSHPVTRSSGEKPVAGTLMFARVIDDNLIKELAGRTSLSLETEAFNQENTASPSGIKSSSIAAVAPQGKNSFNISYVSEALVVGTTVLNDINGKPVLSLNVEMPRDVYQQGQSAIHYMFIVILIMGLVFTIVLSFSLEKSVLSRISLLNTNLTEISKKGSLSSRVNISGVFLVDAETSAIVEVNPVAEELIGLPSKEIIGKSFHQFICKADESECSSLNSGFKTDRSERVLINRDGNKVPIMKSMVPITISDKKYLVESFVDLTRIKQAEDSLIQAKITAETANRAKSEFLATMSHELRTPLNSVIGFSDLMMTGNVGEISEKQRKFLGNISMSGKHLLALINNILDISKIEAGKMELSCETFDVEETVNEVKQLISPLIEKKGLKAEFSLDEKLVSIYADKTRFKQILFNLASNAIKFTPVGGNINISSQICGETAQFTVRDTGIGIDEKDQHRLFRPFTQLDSATNRMYEGTGLGLSLVKSFVEMHEGKIWFESEVGKGTAFTFEIPLAACLNKEGTNKEGNAEATKEPAESINENTETIKKQAEIKEQTKTVPEDTGNAYSQTLNVPQIIEPADSSGDEPLILVAEDDDASRELLEFTLTQEGYRVASVPNGKEALELANKMKPFAITLDIMMPGMSGWEVLKHLKLEKQTYDIPVIITSMLDERELGVVWGALEHFIKPVQKDKLLLTLEKIKEKEAKPSFSVLMVDDEKTAVELVAAMLCENEFNVLKAYGGREAIDIACKELPDVIILDLMMPDISGYDVIKALKSRPETIDIPIIICTAKDLDFYEIKELDKNVSSIMHKGMFTRDDLLECIGQIQKANQADSKSESERNTGKTGN